MLSDLTSLLCIVSYHNNADVALNALTVRIRFQIEYGLCDDSLRENKWSNIIKNLRYEIYFRIKSSETVTRIKLLVNCCHHDNIQNKKSSGFLG